MVRILTASSAVFQPFIPSIAFAASFGGINIVATPDSPVAVMTADFDGDGFMDIVATISAGGSAGSKVSWYENSCTSTPCTPTWTEHIIEADFSAEGGRAQGLAVGDVDNDGDKDIVITNGAGDDIYLYENDGSGNFTRAVIVENRVRMLSVILADLNKDGFLDVVVHEGNTASTGDEVSYSLNQCASTPCDVTWGTLTYIDGSVGGADSGTDVAHWQGVVAADMDADGYLDVVAMAAGVNDLIWYENPCTSGGSTGSPCTTFGAFAATTISANVGSTPNAIFVTRVGNDADMDILVALNDGTVSLFYSDGGSPPSFTERTSIISGLGAALAIIATRIDTDDDVDIVVASGGTVDDLNWYASDGGTDAAVTFSLGETLDDNLNNGNAVWITDIDNDGARDIVVGANAGDVIGWYEGTDTPTAVEAHSFAAQPAPGGTALSWRTATEIRTLGFNIYASDSPLSNSWSLLTHSPIPALRPGDLTGDSYSWTDSSLSLASSRCYFLDELLVGGSSNGYGPACTPLLP